MYENFLIEVFRLCAGNTRFTQLCEDNKVATSGDIVKINELTELVSKGGGT
jgi:hypothetical protein